MTRMLRDPRQLNILEWLAETPKRGWRAHTIARRCEGIKVPNDVDGHEYSQLLMDLKRGGLVESSDHSHIRQWKITSAGMNFLKDVSKGVRSCESC